MKAPGSLQKSRFNLNWMINKTAVRAFCARTFSPKGRIRFSAEREEPDVLFRKYAVPTFAGMTWIFFFFFFTLPSLYALQVPAKPEGYISDYAGMLSPAKYSALDRVLRSFANETSNQIAVVTFPSLEWEVLEDFSIRLAEAWKIGQKGKDNGVILLIFRNDRKVRIEVGYGLESVLPDAVCKLIIENEIVPRFREGNYDAGIEAAINAIMAAIRGEYQVQSPHSSTDWEMIMALIVVLLIFLVPFVFYLFAGRTSYVITGKGNKRKYFDYGSGFDTGGFSMGRGFSGDGFSGGGGGFGGGGASGSW